MHNRVWRTLQTLGRIRDFIRAHPFSGSDDGSLVVRFDELLARAHALAAQERGMRVDAASAARRRKELWRALHELTRCLSRLGDFTAPRNPDFGGRFDAPGRTSRNALFLTKAWELLEAARVNREALALFGLDGASLDDLAVLINHFEAAAERAAAGRRGHLGARAELGALVAKLLDLIAILDSLNQVRFKDKAELLVSWNAARTVAFQTGVRTVPGSTDPDLGKAA
jgi:hypothetical protein